MFCPRCGIENKPDAPTCISCGNDLRTWGRRDPDAPQAQGYGPPPAPLQQPYPGRPYGPPERIPNYLGFSITLCVVGLCCWILPTAFAIPAIVFGSQVDTKVRFGDIAGATEASRNAKIWCWLSFALVVAIGLLQITFFAVPFLGGIA